MLMYHHSQDHILVSLLLVSQANYAAANAALDAYAAQQAAVGTTTIAVQWGAWSAVGEPRLALPPPPTQIQWLATPEQLPFAM